MASEELEKAVRLYARENLIILLNTDSLERRAVDDGKIFLDDVYFLGLFEAAKSDIFYDEMEKYEKPQILVGEILDFDHLSMRRRYLRIRKVQNSALRIVQ